MLPLGIFIKFWLDLLGSLSWTSKGFNFWRSKVILCIIIEDVHKFIGHCPIILEPICKTIYLKKVRIIFSCFCKIMIIIVQKLCNFLIFSWPFSIAYEEKLYTWNRSNISVWCGKSLMSTGLEPALSHTEKSLLTSTNSIRKTQPSPYKRIESCLLADEKCLNT